MSGSKIKVRAMSGNPPKSLASSAGVRLMIPLLYAAWADRVLSPTEVDALRRKADKLSFLSKSDKSILLNWSNPRNPPSPALFKMWEIDIKQIASRARNQRLSLTEIGLQMAQQAAEKNQQTLDWDMPQVRATLAELEESLSQVNLDTYRSLFPQNENAHFRDSTQTAAMAAEIGAILDAPYQATKDRMRQLLSDPFFAYRELPVKEDYREQVLLWLHELADRGLGGLSYPEAFGGADDMGRYAAVFEMMGHHDISLAIKFGVQFGLFGGAVHSLGTESHHQKYLADIASMKLPGCFAMTETGHGSNVRGLETTAVYDAATDEIIVHTPHPDAGKEYIGNALHGRMGAVFAQLIVNGENHGVHAVLVPLRNQKGDTLPGIKIEDSGYKLGLNGVDNGRIWFDEVRVPRANLLDRFGSINDQGQYHSPIESSSRRFFTMLGTLVGGRVCVPRAGLAAAKSALTIAIRYALKRRQFAPNHTAAETLLLDYPMHQKRLLPQLARAYAVHFGLDYLLERYIHRHEGDLREIETLAAGMKSYATWFTTECIQECREACGGKGYLAENRFAALKADTEIFTTFEGDNTVLMQLVAKGLIAEFREEFSEYGNYLGVLRYISRRVNTAIAETNPIIVRNTDPAHIRDTEWHLTAFNFRQQRLLDSLVNRIRTLIKKGHSAYSATLICQPHMVSLAEAYIEKIVLSAFAAQIAVLKKEKKGEHIKVLELVIQLYAIDTIERHKAWYLEKDYISSGKSKSIKKEFGLLLKALRPYANLLVESFNIPDELLAAPIAGRT